MKSLSLVTTFAVSVVGFHVERTPAMRNTIYSELFSSCDNSNLDASTILCSEIAQQFTISTCMSKSCQNARKRMGLDPYSTFSAFYTRAENTEVNVQEVACVGSCQYGPCCAVEHEDYVGQVALEGMAPAEFNARAFHSIVTEEDADRVWDCVQSAILIMSTEEAEGS